MEENEDPAGKKSSLAQRKNTKMVSVRTWQNYYFKTSVLFKMIRLFLSVCITCKKKSVFI